MNTFKRNALTTAVFAGLGIAGSAHAVYQDANGLGQALIYPYYTVQNDTAGNPFNTYLSVVNTTASGKVVKVRFREGRNSREVLDFNLYLSPNDVWTAAIIPDPPGGTTVGGRLITLDNSCTNPAIPVGGVAFRNTQYTGSANDDGSGTGLDRTREGYVEMFEMATVIGASLAAITHSSAGVPANCALVQGTPVVGLLTAPPSGGLTGTGTLINVADGADAGYEAIALANVTAAANYTDVGTELGTLAGADPISVVVTSSATGTRTYTSAWGLVGIDAVSSTMMHTNVINEYVMDSATKSNTDWVLTFPTKRYYVTAAAAAAPFTNKYLATGACEPISFTFFNREERGATAGGGDFSPLPPGSPASALCWESTVLSFRSGLAQNPTGTTSGVLGSVNTTPVNLTTGFQSGWANVQFTGAASIAPGLVSGVGSTTRNVTTNVTVVGAQTYQGLPVVGFMVRTFQNGTLSCAGVSCQGNYGSAFNHNYIDTVAPAP
jgi:hypothetical protein